MTDYDFSSLTPDEFEVLCVDLMSAMLGERFERYKPGKDAGIDGKCFSAGTGEIILQCKHWRSTPIEKMLRHLETKEAKKVARLKPGRYIFATSKPLSYNDKKKISGAFGNDILSGQDVIGREDLNDILAKHPVIERRHYKLWIQSSAALDAFLNADIYGRSDSLLDEVRRQTSVYVVTENHHKAQRKLNDNGTVIITGAPGVGKTTLAQHLLLDYLVDGFELFVIAESISEAEKVYKPSEKQIFYFDDFFGRNYLQALSGYEGNHIVQFIKRIRKSRSKRFVLTSRTTILNQAKIYVDNFHHERTESDEHEIVIDSLSDVEKARILYNHIWYSELPSEHIEQLYSERRYRDVIFHKAFNPRLVRYITDAEVKSEVTSSEYWEHVKALLEDPAQIWQHPFEAQIDDFGRAVVLLVAANSGPIKEEELNEAYHRFISASGSAALRGIGDFQITLKHLCGSLLSRRISRIGNADATVDLFNPSVGDFALSRFARDMPLLERAVISLRSTGPNKSIRGLLSEGRISRAQAAGLVAEMLRNAVHFNFMGYSPDLVAECSSMFIKYSSRIADEYSILRPSVEFLLESEPPHEISSAAQFLNWAMKSGFAAEEALERWIISSYEAEPDLGEIELLTELGAAISPISKDKMIRARNRCVVSYFREAVSSEFEISDIFDGVEITNLDEAKSNLEDLVISALHALDVDPEAGGVDDIVAAYDMEAAAFDLISDYQNNRPAVTASAHTSGDEIDAIFGTSDPRVIPGG